MDKGSLLLKNCRVFNPQEVKGRSDILMVDGKIRQIGRRIRARAGIPVLDCKGRIAAPGFIDLHIHGAGGADDLVDTTAALQTMSLTIARTGVTSFLATAIAAPIKENKYLREIAEAVKTGLPGAQVLGTHIEGPFINVTKRGMIRADTIQRASKRLLKQLIEEAGGTIRMLTVAPEIPGNIELIRYMKKHKIVASLGHTIASYDQAMLGIKAGITQATHIFNAMTSLNHREPGAPGAIFDSETVSAQLICDGKHISPTVIRMIYKILPPERICIITDSMPDQGLKDGHYKFYGTEYDSVDGTCYYKDGTLVGTAVPLNEMGRRFMKFTGAPLSEVFTTLSYSSAKSLGLKKGRIVAGYDADIVITDEKLKIFGTVVKGRLVV